MASRQGREELTAVEVARALAPADGALTTRYSTLPAGVPGMSARECLSAGATTQHVPVLLSEVLYWLAPRPGATMVDGTLGGGGYAAALCDLVGPLGRVIALDVDPAAVRRGAELFRNKPVALVHGSFADLPEHLRELGACPVDGIVLDLGVSSDQLGDSERGFSFQSSGKLDMRFDPGRGEPAYRLLARLSERELADLIYRYGEERHSRRIARGIVAARQRHPITQADELAALVRRLVPRRRDRIDPATRTFQALRIAVNAELESLEKALAELPGVLRPGGRLVIVSFHSLEDRLVKGAFRADPRLRVLTKKPVIPGVDEVSSNPRSRSAKLRAAVRI